MTIPSTGTELFASVLIDGGSVDSDSAPVMNPAKSQEEVGRVALGSEEHVGRAVTAARMAFRGWSSMSIQDRAAHLGAAAEKLRTELDIDRLARLLTLEHGKVLQESYVDLQAGIGVLDYYQGLADQLVDEVTEDKRGRIAIGRRPMGVAGVIVPWNYPVILGMQMLVPALLAGNTTVIKPATEVPLAFSEVLRVLASALPPGVLNSVPGHGATAGSALVKHPDVRKISFTGSVATGQRILRDAADEIKRVTLELGGNDPALILESAELNEKMFTGLVKGVYTSAGQICYNVKRIYVHRRHYDNFVDQFCEFTNRQVVGDGLDPASSFGPLNSKTQYDKVQEMLVAAEARGATVRHLGTKLNPEQWEEGFFMLPAVVTDAPEDVELVCEEQFGPVVPIVAVDSDEEAIGRANNSPYGLTASVWTEDEEYGFSLAPRIEAGSVFVNVHRVGASDVSIPFGGYKKSGLGRSHGLIAVQQNTEVQAVIKRSDM